jgi:hypothetical protein
MANVKITWQLPAANIDMSNIDAIVVHKLINGTCATLTNAATNGTDLVHSDANKTLEEYTDVGVGQGAWVYGVFAKNAAGVSPCTNASWDGVAIA